MLDTCLPCILVLISLFFSPTILTLFVFFFFFFNDTATTEIYTLSLHDALPISVACERQGLEVKGFFIRLIGAVTRKDRKSTRLNSSHVEISYAVFCLKKKKKKIILK